MYPNPRLNENDSFNSVNAIDSDLFLLAIKITVKSLLWKKYLRFWITRDKFVAYLVQTHVYVNKTYLCLYKAEDKKEQL